MNDAEFRAFLDLLMVSDPFPLLFSKEDTLKDYANSEARRRGYSCWITAYHTM